jgi:Ca-activated chloride channel family protein
MKKYLFIVLALGIALIPSMNGRNGSSPNDQFDIKGTVYNEWGTPLADAVVQIHGKKIKTTTDQKGRFTIMSPDSCVALKASKEGYLSRSEISACSGKEVNFRLPTDPDSPLAEEIMEESEVMYDMTIQAQPLKSSKSKKMRANRAMAIQQPQAYYSPTEPAPNWNTEDYGVITENRFLRPTDNPLSTFSIDVDAAAYSNIRRFISNGQKPPKDAVRIEEMVNYFEYKHEQPKGNDPFAVDMEMADCPWAPDHKLLAISLQGEKIPYDNLPASNLVFLIDVSGSMSAANKLPLLKSSFKLLTDQLRAEDRVAIVVYAGAAGVVLEPTPGNQKQAIKGALDKLEAGGSTAGGAGIQLAYKLARENFVEGGNNRVILATDGDFNIGESSDAAMVRLIEKERKSGVFLTVLGFGMGNYKDNKMQQLANKGNGNHAYIDNINEAKKVLISEFGGTMFAIAKDVKLQLEFNPAKVAGYRLIGYENRMLNKEDFNDDEKDAGELGSGHTVTALYEIIPSGVKSDFLANVDDLKYQNNKVKTSSKDWISLKLRYKKPDGDKSQLIETTYNQNPVSWQKTSDNFRWAAAVTEFGLILRESPFKQKASYKQAIELAKSAVGEDKNGYRHEFIRMLEVMQDMESPVTAEK